MSYTNQNMLMQQISSTVSYFIDKKATSPASAIEMTSTQWAQLGHLMDPTELGFLNPYKHFIKKTDTHRYYVDEQSLDVFFKKSTQQQKKLMMYLPIAIVITLLLLFLISLHEAGLI